MVVQEIKSEMTKVIRIHPLGSVQILMEIDLDQCGGLTLPYLKPCRVAYANKMHTFPRANYSLLPSTRS